MRQPEKSIETTYRNYLIGFGLSLATTFLAYFMVVEEWTEGWTLLLLLGGLALSQMIVQLYFFLHLGEEMKPRLRAWSFAFMTIILLIIVGGSLWIMGHLNYNMMELSPSEKDHYMMGEKDKGF